MFIMVYGVNLVNFGGAVWTIVMVKKQKSRFTTTTTVGIGKHVPNR